MPRIAAFFDIDHTLIDGDSAMLMARYLVRKGELRWYDLLGPAYYTVLYRLNLLDIDAVFRRYQRRVRGRSHEEMQTVSEAWYRECVQPLIFPSMAEKLAEHRERGDVVAFLSSATTYVAEPLARELEVTHLLTNRLLMKEGLLTGEAAQPLCWGPGKTVWARRFAEEHDIDLDRSWFYSDSISDMPVLELVGNPVIVNPDRLLRRQAERRGWPVIDPPSPRRRPGS